MNTEREENTLLKKTTTADNKETAGCCGKRSSLEKKLIFLVVFLFLIVISSITALIFIKFFEKEVKPKDVKVSTTTTKITKIPPLYTCYNKICNDTAKAMKAAMDESIDPCDDFYEFTCGNYIKNHKLKPDQAIAGPMMEISDRLNKKIIDIMENKEDKSLSKSVDAMRTYYKTCMDTEILEHRDLKPLQELLAEIGDWPILGNRVHKKNDSSLDVGSLVKVRNLGVSLIIGVDVVPNPKMNSQNIIQLNQMSSFGIGKLSLINFTNVNEEIFAYIDFINKSVNIMSNNSIQNQNALHNDIMNLIAFESELANNVIPEKQRNNAEEYYNPMTIDKLINEVPSIDWYELITRTFEEVNIKITRDTVIDVPGLPFFKKIPKIIKHTNPYDISNYIGWRVVQKYGRLSIQKFRDAEFKFMKVIYGLEEVPLRNVTCSKMTTTAFAYVATSEFAKKNFPPEDKANIIEIVEDIREAFFNNLETLTWMDEKTKLQAKLKTEAVVRLIGYPDWILNDFSLDNYYSYMIDNVRNDSTLENHYIHEMFTRSWEINRVNKESKRDEWNDPRINPLSVDALYYPNENSIYILTGIINFPFYTKGLPRYMNYGGIGMVAGHELIHGFDDFGRQFDDKGNLNNWWSESSLKKFKNKTKCMVDQYSKFVEPGTKLKINGKQTISENIADNGGTKDALSAYRIWISKHGVENKLPNFEKYSNDQMYFLAQAYAQCAKFRPATMKNLVKYNEHSPPRFRILGSNINYHEFAKTWSCSANKKMNPKNRCSIW